MTSSSTLLSLVLLVASSSAWGMVCAHGDGFTHIHMYMNWITTGPNATEVIAVPSRLGGDTTFGQIELVDNELRDGPDPTKSSLLGRFQGIGAYAGLVSPPGYQTVISFVFTSGKHNGSMLFMVGTILSFERPFERPLVGGTGAFRMSRGYCVLENVSSTPMYNVFEVNLYVKMDA